MVGAARAVAPFELQLKRLLRVLVDEALEVFSNHVRIEFRSLYLWRVQWWVEAEMGHEGPSLLVKWWRG
jgi:hypothetical protein